MVDKTGNMLADLKAYLETPEGLANAKEFFGKAALKDEIYQSQLDRAYEKFGESISELVNKVLTKYDSKEYIARWLKKGYYEAPEPLKFFLCDYASKFGRAATQREFNKYGNTFSADMFILDGYVFNLMIGQGSVVQIFKK